MFYTLFFKLDFFKSNTFNEKKYKPIIIFILGTIIYCLIHYILFSNLLNKYKKIQKYKYSFYVILTLDLLTFFYFYKNYLYNIRGEFINDLNNDEDNEEDNNEFKFIPYNQRLKNCQLNKEKINNDDIVEIETDNNTNITNNTNETNETDNLINIPIFDKKKNNPFLQSNQNNIQKNNNSSINKNIDIEINNKEEETINNKNEENNEINIKNDEENNINEENNEQMIDLQDILNSINENNNKDKENEINDKEQNKKQNEEQNKEINEEENIINDEDIIDISKQINSLTSENQNETQEIDIIDV